MTYVLSIDYFDESFVDAHVNDASLLDGIRLRSGDRLLNRFPELLEITVEPHSDISDFFLIGSLTVVSQRFQTIATGYRVHAEWFPLRLYRDGIPQDGYVYMNLLDSIDCLDRDRSDFEERKGFATNLQRIVLKPVVAEPPLYILAKATPFLFLVRDDLAERLRLSMMTGFSLERDVQWRSRSRPL